MNEAEFLVELYKEQTTHGRHTETQRLEVTKFLMAGVAALAGVMGALKFSIHTIPISIAIIYMGFFGKRFTAIYVERFDGHMARARALRKAADAMLAGGRAQALLNDHKLVKADRLRLFWARMYTATIVFGFLLLLISVAVASVRIATYPGSLRDGVINELAPRGATNP